MTTTENDTTSLDADLDAERLVSRLRQLADEIASAHRYGVPLPTLVSVGSHRYSGASFSATAEQFTAWADYCIGSEVEEYDHSETHWWSATADVNGLPLAFSARDVPILVNDEASA